MAHVFLGDHGDEAIDRRANRDASTPKRTVKVRGPDVGVESGRFQKQELAKETHDLRSSLLSPEPLENFGDDDSAGMNLVVTRDHSREGTLLP
jgi:hypothetical protein